MNKNGSRWLPKWKRLAVYMRDGFACVYCERDLKNADPREVTLDHLTPRVNGGGHGAENLVTACLTCNSRRRDTCWRAFAGHRKLVIARLVQRKLNEKLAKSLVSGKVAD